MWGRPSLFVDHPHRHAGGGSPPPCPRGDDLEASACRSRATATARALSPFFTVMQTGCPRWAAVTRAELALEHRLAEAAPDAHHLAGGAHLGPRIGSTPGNLLNGKTASLTEV